MTTIRTVSLEAERRSTRKTCSRVGVERSLSPYFFPELVRCFHSRGPSQHENSGEFEVTFRYLDDEPGTNEPYPSGGMASVVLGKHTGRILSIRFGVDEHKADRIGMLVSERVIPALMGAKDRRPEMAPNYALIADALLEHEEEIQDALLA
jgi:hypothetical protein